METTLGPAVGMLGVAPDFVLVFVVCWAMAMGSEEAMLLGAVGGLCLDLLSGAPLGTHALVGYLSGIITRSPFSSRVVIPALVMAAATILYDVLIVLILRLAGQPLPEPRFLATIMIASVITNGIVGPGVYWLLVRVAEARGSLRPEF
jgi:rod shape-determining protein MreD